MTCDSTRHLTSLDSVVKCRSGSAYAVWEIILKGVRSHFRSFLVDSADPELLLVFWTYVTVKVSLIFSPRDFRTAYCHYFRILAEKSKGHSFLAGCHTLAGSVICCFRYFSIDFNEKMEYNFIHMSDLWTCCIFLWYIARFFLFLKNNDWQTTYMRYIDIGFKTRFSVHLFIRHFGVLTRESRASKKGVYRLSLSLLRCE